MIDPVSGDEDLRGPAEDERPVWRLGCRVGDECDLEVSEDEEDGEEKRGGRGEEEGEEEEAERVECRYEGMEVPAVGRGHGGKCESAGEGGCESRRVEVVSIAGDEGEVFG